MALVQDFLSELMRNPAVSSRCGSWAKTYYLRARGPVQPAGQMMTLRIRWHGPWHSLFVNRGRLSMPWGRMPSKSNAPL